MRVAVIKLYNWGPFKGEHSVALGSGVYGLTACTLNDSDRSNWQGKTWFLNAILFAFTGVIPPECNTKDDWITRGESSGSVGIMTDEGDIIQRSKKRGKSEQLTFTPQKKGGVARQVAAGDLIDKLIGFSSSDLLAGCFVRQKQIDRLVKMRSGDLTEIVNGWLELAPLEIAEKTIRDGLNDLIKKRVGLEGELSSLRQGEDDPYTETEGIRDELARAKVMKAEILAEKEQLDIWQRTAKEAEEWQSVNNEGRDLSTQLSDCGDSDDSGSRIFAEKILEVKTNVSAVSKRLAQEEELAKGEFDGRCPISNVVCPARDVINDQREEHDKEAQRLQQHLGICDEKLSELESKRAVIAEEENKAQRIRGQLVQLRRRASELRPSAVEFGKMGEEPPQLRPIEAVDYLIESTTREIAMGEMATVNAKRLAERVLTKEKEIEALKTDVVVYGEALAIVGRSGAQKDIASVALEFIEAGANELLISSGIDLTISISWSREAAKGLAINCGGCGAPFPSSQRVKVCDNCQAARGPKIIESLELQLSSRSGAAEDLAGLAFQLAGSQWLKMVRGSAFGLTCIDEPFGALDKANAKSLSSKIANMLSQKYAFEQAIIVAHDRSLMEALPNRIQITGGPEGSTIEVFDGT